MAGNLENQARRFADEISELLNNTVTHGIRISSLNADKGHGIIGKGIKSSNPNPAPIPISPSDKKAVVFLPAEGSSAPESSRCRCRSA